MFPPPHLLAKHLAGIRTFNQNYDEKSTNRFRFTAVAAALGPLLMGTAGDLFGHVRYGFILATGFAGCLFITMLFNHLFDPAAKALRMADQTEY